MDFDIRERRPREKKKKKRLLHDDGSPSADITKDLVESTWKVQKDIGGVKVTVP